jgi:hypothetical protein
MSKDLIEKCSPTLPEEHSLDIDSRCTTAGSKTTIQIANGTSRKVQLDMDFTTSKGKIGRHTCTLREEHRNTTVPQCTNAGKTTTIQTASGILSRAHHEVATGISEDLIASPSTTLLEEHSMDMDSRCTLAGKTTTIQTASGISPTSFSRCTSPDTSMQSTVMVPSTLLEEHSMDIT